MTEITSATNPRVQHLRALQDKSFLRKESGCFVIEGERMVLDAPPESIKEVYVTKEKLEELKDHFGQDSGRSKNRLEQEPSVTILSSKAMEKASATRTPQGILAVAALPQWVWSDVVRDSREHFLLLLENIQDPGNLGTMFRTAEAAGVDGIILSSGSVDVFNPKTVRATMSSLFRVPFVIVPDMPETIQRLRNVHQICVHAACPEQGSIRYDTVDGTKSSAFLVGNEAKGLTKESILASDDMVYIPMEGEIESLNAAMSAGILLFEAARQRGFQRENNRQANDKQLVNNGKGGGKE